MLMDVDETGAIKRKCQLRSPPGKPHMTEQPIRNTCVCGWVGVQGVEKQMKEERTVSHIFCRLMSPSGYQFDA